MVNFKGKTVNFEQSSPCHRSTIAHFLNYGKWNDNNMLEDILKQTAIDIIYHEAAITEKPVLYLTISHFFFIFNNQIPISNLYII